MKIFVYENYEEMSKHCAAIMLGEMTQDKHVNISPIAGKTPNRVYEILAEAVQGNEEAYKNVDYYIFDEATDGDPVTQIELEKSFFKPLQVKEEQIFTLTLDNYTNFAREIDYRGGMDLTLLGLGDNGHFCSNQPGTTEFLSDVYISEPKPEYEWYDIYKNYYGNNPMPIGFITVGASLVMKSKKLVMIVNGKLKAEAVKELVEGKINENFPSSALKLHPNFVLLLDKEAASLIDY